MYKNIMTAPGNRISDHSSFKEGLIDLIDRSFFKKLPKYRFVVHLALVVVSCMAAIVVFNISRKWIFPEQKGMLSYLFSILFISLLVTIIVLYLWRKEKKFKSKIYEELNNHQATENDLRNLNNLVSEMLLLKDLKSIYSYVAESLVRIYPGAIITHISVNENNMTTRFESVSGLDEGLLEKFTKITGFNPVGRDYKLLPIFIKYYKSGELIEFKGDLSDFCAGQFPSAAARAIELICGLSRIYTIGINWNEKTYSAIHLFTLSEEIRPDGDFIKIFAKQTAILLQKRIAELSLEKSEMQFRLLLNSAAEGIYGLDMDGRCTFCNRKALQVLGYSDIGEVAGKNMHYLIHHTHQDGSRFDVNTCNIYRAFNKGEEIHSEEEFFFRKDGSSFPVEYWSYPIFHDDKVTGAVITFFDITEKKNIKKNLTDTVKTARTLLNSTERITFLIDSGTFRILDINEIGVKALGKSAQELIGRNAFDFMQEDAAANARIKITEAAHNLKTSSFLYQNSGKFYFYEIHPICDESGKPDRFAVFVQDITDMKSNEANLKSLNDKLTKINATKDKLFSIIAHDLRNPVSSTLSLSELLNENFQTFDNKKLFHYIGLINTSSKITLELLDNLLQWSRVQGDHFEFNPGNISLEPVVRKIIETLRPSAKLKDIRIEYLKSEELICHCDLNMLQIILRNVIQNAVKFTNHGGRIEISSAFIDGQVRITVTDNGIGMDEAKLQNIFRNGANKPAHGTANEKGSGLGLILCKDFVEMLGGKIWAESSPDKGSRFIFTLPKAQA